MVDALTISGALTSLKTVSEIAKTLVGLRDKEQIRSKVIDLQTAIIAAQTNTLELQSEYGEALKKIRELEAEVTTLKAGAANRIAIPEALRCPMCGESMKVANETEDPDFSFAGLKVHQVTCVCGHQSTRQFKGGKYL